MVIMYNVLYDFIRLFNNISERVFNVKSVVWIDTLVFVKFIFCRIKKVVSRLVYFFFLISVGK